MRLSEQLRRGRIDRPDEWTMDRYLEKAETLENTIRELVDVSEDMSNGRDVGNRLIAHGMLPMKFLKITIRYI